MSNCLSMQQTAESKYQAIAKLKTNWMESSHGLKVDVSNKLFSDTQSSSKVRLMTANVALRWHAGKGYARIHPNTLSHSSDGGSQVEGKATRPQEI